VLDVGCGEGHVLAALARSREIDATGLDISVAAVDHAARSFPGARWVVANADRTIPLADGSIDLVLSITSRRNASEFARVLCASGRLVVAVPAGDDLVELREAVLGRRVVESRVERVVSELTPMFELQSVSDVRRSVRLDRGSIGDVLALTYRGARRAEREHVERLDVLDVTLSRDVLVFRPLASRAR
jgi:23S rRNA (guanine745-N1)-methyltransferase